ncbi:MAG: hypothetical protein HKP59_11625 [Lutibacter sp.]|uniref:GIN domain-containing protein n=1 Tax=Lutibacter sp. TaxID=1925666 RepID=UPI0017A32810|nr:DUF2807 domain-containing protein [Lutibacter sp.]MBT8318263.1 DUF2807 domain-containing protein [Lutibacter sp.]NNJ59122.1 hypothetical protein [Lutibacter sp.]
MKTIYKIPLLIVLFLTSFLSAQEKIKGNKEVTRENRNISNFDKIEIIDNLDVKLVYNADQSVNVETDSNLQSSIITSVNNGMLSVSIQNKIVNKKELMVHINVNSSLKEINGYNKSNIESNNSLNIDTLTINSFDNCDINLKLNSKLLRINSKKISDLKFEILSEQVFINSEESSSIKGTIDAVETIFSLIDKSVVNINGSTNVFEIETLGNSTFKGKDFTAKDVVINASNSSNAYIKATKSIDIYTKNSAEVYLYDNPKITLSEFFDKSSIYKKE